MTHLEPVEPRRLCAASPDPTFGKHGGVSLPTDKYIVDNILATHGAVYVSATDRNRLREVVFKYNEDGSADTHWGLGGYVVPAVYARPVADLFYSPNLVMGYDARTKGLVVGYGDFDRVMLERRDASGAIDTAWGTQGHFTYRENGPLFTLDQIVPVAGKKVLLVARRQGLNTVTDQVTRPDADPPGHLLLAVPGGPDDVVLMRLDRLGRRDHVFNNGRAITVAAGSLTDGPDAVRVQHTVIKGHQDIDTPAFCDLQVLDDGSVRVVTTRVKVSRVVSQPDARLTYSDKTAVSAASTVVSAAGAIVAGRSQTYDLAQYRSYSGAGSDRAAYEPVTAFATGDDGVAVLADSPDGSVLQRLTPRRRSKPATLFTQDIEHEYAVPAIEFARRSVNGDVLVASNTGTILKLTSDLTTQAEVDYGPTSSVATLDDTGRVLSLDGDRVARFV